MQPVLVIEDNRETLLVYKEYLGSSGYQMIPARTLREARAVLARLRPAAVVLDVLLQAESTWELLGELKREAATRDIPVLVATRVENERKALALGANAFCSKPVDRDWLLGNLNRLVCRSKSEAPARSL